MPLAPTLEAVESLKLDAAAPLSEAAELTRDLDVGRLAVAGRETRRECSRTVISGFPPWRTTRIPAHTLVRESTTPRVRSIYAGREAEDAAELMAREHVGGLLVIDHARWPVGIVSLGDLSRRAWSSLPRTAQNETARGATRIPIPLRRLLAADGGIAAG